MPQPDLVFEAIGTRWAISTPVPLTEGQRARVAERIETFDLAYSRFRTDSLVADLARRAGEVLFPDDVDAMMAVYRRLYEATDGAMTPLVGASLERLGYDRDYSLTPSGAALASPVWDDRVSLSRHAIRVSEPTLLDFGAAGKGYLADLVVEALAEEGITDCTVDAGGDLVHHGSAPLRIALEHPYDAGKAIGVIELERGALCGSATNRRAWGSGLHHVLDGLTGEPVHEVAATWVLADTALDADALATALFFVGADRLADFDFRFVRMFTDGSAEFSPDLPGRLFLREGRPTGGRSASGSRVVGHASQGQAR
ncbi:FAD:protein FMN transferase [Naasia lichenicola]|uniref:FAD:protein FMN transferase n=1 Tax=Naasia lichenicola TaxID=2565933 RepID=A0A4S4FEI8_9MICO|nr:FAD:protein FMN transferase [Naasia lichenicola]THG28560.1 FAD:protein FMN transferase [Naasia lichenicola]